MERTVGRVVIRMFWIGVICGVLALWPLNWLMMKNEWGLYNNGPGMRQAVDKCSAEWTEGPNPVGRAWLLIISPVSCPYNFIVQLGMWASGDDGAIPQELPECGRCGKKH